MVGRATAEVFGIKKIFTRKQEDSNITLEEAAKCKFVFICLPTPFIEGQGYKTDDIKAVIKQIDGYAGSPIFIIRSTVYPGFAMHIQDELSINTIISNPEFLSEDTAIDDMKNPPFIVIGGLEGSIRQAVRGYYEARIKGAPIIETDNITAEMIKLTMNSYFATKVIFANEAFDACQKIGVNYSTVKQALESHPYGPKNHFTIVYKGKRGVRGNCLPKDSQAYTHYTGSKLVEKVIELNNDYV